MSFVTIFITAIALAMDAFAVSVSKGMTLRNLSKKICVKIALAFGIFQGVMPLLGWLLGIKFTRYIQKVDHWIAFILLCFIGIKMIIDSLKSEDDVEEKQYNNKTFLILAIATSIDALTVGITFAFLKINIISSVLSIGIITFILSITAVYAGKIIGNFIKNKAGIFGGIILIIMGLKILLQHL